MDPPAGSHSARTQRLCQVRVRARAAVVTPGDPLAEASAMTAIGPQLRPSTIVSRLSAARTATSGASVVGTATSTVTVREPPPNNPPASAPATAVTVALKVRGAVFSPAP